MIPDNIIDDSGWFGIIPDGYKSCCIRDISGQEFEVIIRMKKKEFDVFFNEAERSGPYISAQLLRNYLRRKAQEWLDMPTDLQNNPLNVGAYNFCRACMDDLELFIKGGPNK